MAPGQVAGGSANQSSSASCIQRMRDDGAACPAPPPFAPSPTGPLHLGSAVVAVADALAAAASAATVLRIDDTDAERTVAGAEEGILADLAWLGLELRASPCARASGASTRSPRRELLATARLSLLLPALAGALRRALPRAPARRRRAAARGRRAERHPFPRARRRGRRGRRDARRGALRGRGDLRSCSCARTGGRRSTRDLGRRPRSRDHAHRARRGSPRQLGPALLLLRALGAGEPVFAHCPIIVADEASGSRRAAAPSPWPHWRARRAARSGRAYAAQLACPAQGGASEVASFGELARRFSLARLGRGTAHADPSHLEWLGREVLAGLPSDELARRLAAFMPAGDGRCRARSPSRRPRAARRRSARSSTLP